MALQSHKPQNRSFCCRKDCFKFVNPLKIKHKTRKDIILQFVKVHPCKTRKVQDRIRPKNCYREYFLPGSDGSDIKVCKNIFMRTVKCSSDFIGKTLDHITKAVVENLKDKVDTPSNRITHTIIVNGEETLRVEQPSNDRKKMDNLPLMIEEINNLRGTSKELSITNQALPNSQNYDEDNEITDITALLSEANSDTWHSERCRDETIDEQQANIDSDLTVQTDDITDCDGIMDVMDELSEETAFEASEYLSDLKEDKILVGTSTVTFEKYSNNSVDMFVIIYIISLIFVCLLCIYLTHDSSELQDTRLIALTNIYELSVMYIALKVYKKISRNEFIPAVEMYVVVILYFNVIIILYDCICAQSAFCKQVVDGLIYIIIVIIYIKVLKVLKVLRDRHIRRVKIKQIINRSGGGLAQAGY